VNSHCQTCLYLENGQVAFQGNTPDAISFYLSSKSENQIDLYNKQGESLFFPELEISLFDLLDEQDLAKCIFLSSEVIRLILNYDLHENNVGLRVGFDLVKLDGGEIIFRTFDDDIKTSKRELGFNRSVCEIPSNLLKAGNYRIDLQIGIHNVRWISSGEHSIEFEVINVSGVNAAYSDYRPGVIMPSLKWETS
jgi:hypothetical protein